jgi:outer membrane biosynthesis protein TonB
MKTFLRQTVALVSCVALMGTTAIPLYASESDPSSEVFAPSEAMRFPAPETSDDLLAFDMNRIVTQQTRLIRYQATEYQRKVAEQRARAFVAAQRKAIEKAKVAQSKPKPTPKSTAKTTEKPSKTTEKPSKTTAKKTETPSKPEKPVKPEKPQVEETKVAEKPKELPRYIAVDTVKDKRASPKAKKVVMLWDTHSEALVSNNIYEVENPPPVGAKTKFETYSAEYIGAGL